MAQEINIREGQIQWPVHHIYGFCLLARFLRRVLYLLLLVVRYGIPGPISVQTQSKLPHRWKIFQQNWADREDTFMVVHQHRVFEQRNLLPDTVTKVELENPPIIQVRSSALIGNPCCNSPVEWFVQKKERQKGKRV